MACVWFNDVLDSDNHDLRRHPGRSPPTARVRFKVVLWSDFDLCSVVEDFWFPPSNFWWQYWFRHPFRVTCRAFRQPRRDGAILTSVGVLIRCPPSNPLCADWPRPLARNYFKDKSNIVGATMTNIVVFPFRSEDITGLDIQDNDTMYSLKSGLTHEWLRQAQFWPANIIFSVRCNIDDDLCWPLRL